MQDTVKLQEVDKGSLECREGSSGVAAFCDRRSAILNDLYICLNRGNFLWRQKERSNMFKVIWTKWKRGIGFLFFTIFVFIVEEEGEDGGAAGRGWVYIACTNICLSSLFVLMRCLPPQLLVFSKHKLLTLYSLGGWGESGFPFSLLTSHQ